VPDALYFEDFPHAEVVEYGEVGISAEEIIAFAREFDPQPFHTDEQAARSNGRPHRLGMAHVRTAVANELRGVPHARGDSG
jgi:acyl dehydratase